MCILLLGFWPTADSGLASQNAPAVTLQYLSQESDVIALARIETVTCLRGPRGGIYSKVSFDEGEVWKGDKTLDDLEVVQAGGTLGRTRTIVTSACEFSPGEWSVLFLKLNKTGQGVVLGLNQGRFLVDAECRFITSSAAFDSMFDSSTGQTSIHELKSRVGDLLK